MTFDLNRRALVAGAAGAAIAVGARSNASAATAAATADSPVTFGPPEGVALLSRNENPYGPSAKAVAAAHEATKKGAYYAGRAAIILAEMIAEKNGVSANHISIGTGSGEALCAVAQAWTTDGGAILAPELFWDTTAKYAERQGAKIIRAPLTADFDIDLDALEAKLDDSVSLVHITNPNNPTGKVLDPEALRAFCLKVEKRATVLVDEAYNELTDDPDKNSMMDLVRAGKNVIVARTFSKIYGLAGMRIGYTIARPDMSQKIRSNIMSWISSPGLAAAAASYNDETFLKMSKSNIVEGREMVMAALKENGLRYLPSSTNFVYVDVGRDAETFRKAMEKRNIMIRGIYQDYTTWSRVSMGYLKDVERYVKALPEVLNG